MTGLEVLAALVLLVALVRINHNLDRLTNAVDRLTLAELEARELDRARLHLETERAQREREILG